MLCRGRVEGLIDCLEDKDKGEKDHGDGGNPGDKVEQESVGVLAHKVFAIDKKQDEDRYDREPDSVAHLREDEDFPEGSIGKQNDTSADNDEYGVEPVEGRGFPELVVESGFKAEALADNVCSGEGENGGGEKRGIQEAEGKR